MTIIEQHPLVTLVIIGLTLGLFAYAFREKNPYDNEDDYE